MTNANRKQVLDIFSEKLCRNYRDYCRQQGLEESLKGFTTYLIDRELVDGHTIRQYAIIELFHELYPANGQPKTQTVELLAGRFNLTQRTIWNVLRKGESRRKGRR